MEENLSLAFLLGSALRELGKRIRQTFATNDVPVTPEQFGILDMISQKDEFIQSDLASIMDKDKSAILRHIDILEDNKLIIRVNDPADRRKKFLVCTRRGEDLLVKGKKIINEILEDLTRGVPEAQMNEFKKVLIQMKNNAES